MPVRKRTPLSDWLDTPTKIVLRQLWRDGVPGPELARKFDLPIRIVHRLCAGITQDTVKRQAYIDNQERHRLVQGDAK